MANNIIQKFTYKLFNLCDGMKDNKRFYEYRDGIILRGKYGYTESHCAFAGYASD